MADRRASRWAGAAVGIAVGVLLLVLVVRGLDWGAVGRALANSRPALLVPIAATLATHYALKGLRWSVLLSSRVRVSPLLAMRLTMVGFLMNNVVPFRIGELGRPYLLSANAAGVKLPFAVATVLGDKLFDLVAVILCLLVASLAVPMPPYAARGILLLTTLCVGVGAAGAIAARRRQRREGAGSARSALASFADGLATVSSVRVAVVGMLLTAASFALLALSMFLTLRMLGLDGDWMTCVFVLGMIGIGFMIPSAPTNAGNYHYFASQALVMSGVAGADPAFAFALVAHFAQVAVITVAGLVSLIGVDWRRSPGRGG